MTHFTTRKDKEQETMSRQELSSADLWPDQSPGHRRHECVGDGSKNSSELLLLTEAFTPFFSKRFSSPKLRWLVEFPVMQV